VVAALVDPCKRGWAPLVPHGQCEGDGTGAHADFTSRAMDEVYPIVRHGDGTRRSARPSHAPKKGTKRSRDEAS
jgi:hypothetical protein